MLCVAIHLSLKTVTSVATRFGIKLSYRVLNDNVCGISSFQCIFFPFFHLVIVVLNLFSGPTDR